MTRSKFWSMALLGIILVLAINTITVVFNVSSNTEHANVRHGTDAVLARTVAHNGICPGQELHFSPSRGTILILCYIAETRKWGGVIIRITENNGTVPLSPEESYECSAFVESRFYWENVIARDYYFPLYKFPSVKALWEGGYWN